jgi:hypothetical protein
MYVAAPDRYEVNRRVRTILIRHDVDLTKIDYSFIGNTVYLYGELHKNQKGEFNAANIDQMVRELSRIEFVRYINFDLKNWVITYSGRSLNVEKKKAAVTTAGQEVVAEEMAPKEGYVDLDGEKQRELKQQQAKPKREPGTKEE